MLDGYGKEILEALSWIHLEKGPLQACRSRMTLVVFNNIEAGIVIDEAGIRWPEIYGLSLERCRNEVRCFTASRSTHIQALRLQSPSAECNHARVMPEWLFVHSRNVSLPCYSSQCASIHYH